MIPPALHIAPSRLARRWLLILHLAAAGTALLLPVFWCFTALLFVLIHFAWSHHPPLPPDYLQVLPDGRVAITRAGADQQQADILPSSLITAWLIVLHLRTDTNRQYLLLWPDSADRDALRQWRAWLRWSLPALRRRLMEQEEQG